jgi:hypothetical protein
VGFDGACGSSVRIGDGQGRQVLLEVAEQSSSVRMSPLIKDLREVAEPVNLGTNNRRCCSLLTAQRITGHPERSRPQAVTGSHEPVRSGATATASRSGDLKPQLDSP